MARSQTHPNNTYLVVWSAIAPAPIESDDGCWGFALDFSTRLHILTNTTKHGYLPIVLPTHKHIQQRATPLASPEHICYITLYVLHI